MKRPQARRQRGVALILFATVLVLGVAWFTVGALGKAAPTTAERDLKTGAALFAAKQALLSYVAQYAARTDHSVPGRLPCPEPLSPAAGSEGEAASSCSNTTVEFGRLPWKTIGIDQPRDGYGETLWYVLGPGFRSSPINFGSPGQLTVDGAASAAVALIIAPGPALNNLAQSGTPTSPCVKQNQATNRYTTPYSLANFAECFNTSSSPASFVTTASSTWFNDRVITITANDVMDAIAGPVADRMQRQVAVALRNWDSDELSATGRSWGVTHGLPYLPFASSWADPSGTGGTIFCGDQGRYEGLIPILPTCYNNNWTGSATVLGGLTLVSCNNPGGQTYRICEFLRATGMTPLTATITLTTANVARALRSTIRVNDLTISDGGTATMSMALPNSTSDATATITVSWNIPTSLLAIGATVSVRIPHLQNAQVLSDSRLTWFLNNEWYRYTYYAVGRGAVVNPTTTCAAAGDPGCVTVTDLASSNGYTNDKRLVLVLSGRPLSTQAWSSGTGGSSSRSDYFESGNATTGDYTYLTATVTSSFNDRIAACPFQQTTTSGAVSICN